MLFRVSSNKPRGQRSERRIEELWRSMAFWILVSDVIRECGRESDDSIARMVDEMACKS